MNVSTITPSLRTRWILGSAMLLIVLLLIGFNRQSMVELFQILTNRDRLTFYLEQLGLWAPFLSMLIVSLQHMSPVFPGQSVMLAASGYLYGLAGGFFVNMLAAVAASQLTFMVARRAGKPFVNRLLPATVLDRWQEAADKRGFAFFVLNFWIPIIPGNAANYLAGLTSMSSWTFLLASVVGRIPGVFLITLIGAYGLNFSWSDGWSSLWAHAPQTVSALLLWLF